MLHILNNANILIMILIIEQLQILIPCNSNITMMENPVIANLANGFLHFNYKRNFSLTCNDTSIQFLLYHVVLNYNLMYCYYKEVVHVLPNISKLRV